MKIGNGNGGKSALVEIIDYCLCSTRCTIPKGKITDFSYLYTLVMAISDNTYVIARYNWEDGGKMHFSKEGKDFEPKGLELSYFAEKPALPFRDIKNEIECALGLFVTNIPTDAAPQGKKASLRNMVSYLFQHQNLMASKFALFYRFSDFYKRKDVIEQFPVFAGMISQEYYSDLIQLNALKTQLKQKYKKQKANEKSTIYIKENLSPLLKDYFALLEQDFDEKISVQEMLKIASNLPEFDDTQLFGENKITERYSELNAELENLRNKEREILLKIKNVNNASDTGDSFTKMLQDLKQQTSVAEIAPSKKSLLPVHQAVALDTLIIQVITFDLAGIAGISLHGINTAAIGADNNSHMVCGTIQIPIEENGITGGDVFISSCAPLSMRLEPRNTLRLTTSKAWFRSTGLTIAP